MSHQFRQDQATLLFTLIDIYSNRGFETKIIFKEGTTKFLIVKNGEEELLEQIESHTVLDSQIPTIVSKLLNHALENKVLDNSDFAFFIRGWRK